MKDRDKQQLLRFFRSNKIKLIEPPEKYADFFIQNDNILLDLKNLTETDLSKILKKISYSPANISFKYGSDSYSSITNALIDANKKAKRTREDKEYQNSTFVLLLSVISGVDLLFHQILFALQKLKYISYPFDLNGRLGIFSEAKRKFYLAPDPLDGCSLYQNIDYVGIARKNKDLSKWRFELIERPKLPGDRTIRDTTGPFGRFLGIYTPEFRLTHT